MPSTVLSGYAVTKPGSAPTVVAGTVSGNLDLTAVYGYVVTFVTQFGETDPSSAGTVTTTSTGSANLSAIPVSANANVISRNIYRTVGGGASYLLLATIPNNTTTTYVDTIADGSLGAAVPTGNTAHSLQTVDGLVKMTRPLIHSTERNITATGTTIADAYQLTSEINWVATTPSGTGVKLPELNANLTGCRIKIKNNGANTLNVYPGLSTQTINGGSAGAAVTVATTVAIDLVADGSANWQAV